MKHRTYGMLALSIGMALTMVVPAYAVADRVETQKTNMYRGTNNGQAGTWVEYVTRTYRYTADPAKVEVRDAFNAQFGRDPSDAEISAYLSLDALHSGLSNNQIAAIAANVAAGKISLAQAKAQFDQLAALANQNKNSNYPNNLPAAFLQSTGTISAAVANQVGAWGRGSGVATKIEDAYQALGIDPRTKKMPNGQTLSSDFSTMIKQLQDNQMITFDWNFDNLMNDLNRSAINAMGDARARIYNAQGWNGDQANLFSKNSLNDPSLQHDYNAGLGGIVANDALVRSWISTYDGIGSFSNRQDVDLYMAVAYSSAAKLNAESKALRALGLTAEADAKIVAARNVVLLTGNNHDPLVLDLNHNGRIDVTGRSAAKYRNDENKRFNKDGSVNFDLLANGKAIRTEWIKGGDGFLVDNRKNAAIAAITTGKNLTGANLFGDVEGYPGGFLKLGMNFDREAKFAADQKMRLSPEFGVLKGLELNDLMVWVDNGDGVAARNELKSMSDLGITEISVRPVYKNEKGETLEQAYFVQNGEKHLIQEVWFMGE